MKTLLSIEAAKTAGYEQGLAQVLNIDFGAIDTVKVVYSFDGVGTKNVSLPISMFVTDNTALSVAVNEYRNIERVDYATLKEYLDAKTEAAEYAKESAIKGEYIFHIVYRDFNEGDTIINPNGTTILLEDGSPKLAKTNWRKAEIAAIEWVKH